MRSLKWGLLCTHPGEWCWKYPAFCNPVHPLHPLQEAKKCDSSLLHPLRLVLYRRRCWVHGLLHCPPFSR